VEAGAAQDREPRRDPWHLSCRSHGRIGIAKIKDEAYTHIYNCQKCARRGTTCGDWS